MKNRLLIGASDKLALLLHLAQLDCATGLTIIDTDGRFAHLFADTLPKEHTEHLQYFDPADAKHVASFNVFKGIPPADRPKLVQDICAFFDALFTGGSETLTKQNSTFVLANVLTILLDSPDVSFLSVLAFLADDDFKDACLKRCTNRIAIRNWHSIEGWEKTLKQTAFAQAEMKLGTLLLSPTILRTLQDPKSTFYIGKTRIFVADLSRSQLGDAAARMLGTLLVSRAASPVYIYDFGFLASEYLASLFSKGGYTVAVQYLAEVPNGVQQTLLSFDDKYVYRVTPEDAERLQIYVSGVEKPSILSDLSPEEYRPVLKLAPPETSGRFRANLRRSRARHSRKVS
jgi:hypothetical protein